MKRYAEDVAPLARRRGPDPRRPQLRRGRRPLHRQRSAHGLHGGRPDHPPGRAHGAAGDARHHPADRRDRCGSPRATSRCSRSGPVPVKGLAGPDRGLRAHRSGRGADAPPGGGRRGASRASSAATPRSSSSAGPSSSARAGHGQLVAIVGRARRGQVAALLRVHPLASQSRTG